VGPTDVKKQINDIEKGFDPAVPISTTRNLLSSQPTERNNDTEGNVEG
jgi:hypothetical protein